MAATRTRSAGKTTFIKEFLLDNERANAAAINEAWNASGMEGTISSSLVNKMRSKLGLAGNLRSATRRKAKSKTNSTSGGGSKPRGRKPGPKAQAQSTVTMTPALSAPSGRRHDQLVNFEAQIDQLIFEAMKVGDLPEVETVLRLARRELYKKFTS